MPTYLDLFAGAGGASCGLLLAGWTHVLAVEWDADAAASYNANIGGCIQLDIREVRLAAGAEFVGLVCGDVMTMPGLPKVPAAEHIDLDDEGRIVGLS